MHALTHIYTTHANAPMAQACIKTGRERQTDIALINLPKLGRITGKVFSEAWRGGEDYNMYVI